MATTALKAYVVGPRIEARSRVHTTWRVNEARPVTPSVAAASQGRPTGVGLWLFRVAPGWSRRRLDRHDFAGFA